MEVYEGYYENGQFNSINQKISLRGRHKAIMIVENQSADDIMSKKLSVLKGVFDLINTSSEEVPKFEHISFTREVTI